MSAKNAIADNSGGTYTEVLWHKLYKKVYLFKGFFLFFIWHDYHSWFQGIFPIFLSLHSFLSYVWWTSIQIACAAVSVSII